MPIHRTRCGENRGRRGLLKVKELQRNDIIPVKVIDDDVEEFVEVDDKLVALAIQMDAYLMTNDFPLGKVAQSQGVTVLNMKLAGERGALGIYSRRDLCAACDSRRP